MIATPDTIAETAVRIKLRVDGPVTSISRAALTTTSLFFFGTLMDRDLLSLVVDRPVAETELTPAHLKGWERVTAADETYPVLVPRAAAVVGGTLFDASEVDIQRVRFFEDYDYDLQSCMPVLADGTPRSARACFAGSRLKATDKAWTLESWRAAGKEELMFLARHYMACFGRMDVEAAEAVWLDAKRAWSSGARDDADPTLETDHAELA